MLVTKDADTRQHMSANADDAAVHFEDVHAMGHSFEDISNNLQI